MRPVISSFIKASCVKGWHTWLLASHTSHRDDSEMTQKHFKESKKELVLMTYRVCESVSVCVCVCQILTCKATWVFARCQSDYQDKSWFPLVCQHFLESFCICWCLHVLLGGLYSSLQLQTYHSGIFGVMCIEDIPRNLSLCQKKQGSLEPRTFFKNEVMGI